MQKLQHAPGPRVLTLLFDLTPPFALITKAGAKRPT
jgi:hypothetical protein